MARRPSVRWRSWQTKPPTGSRRGRTLIDHWAASDTGVLYMEESTDVEMNKTYTLTVRYTINGADQSPCTVSKTNR